MASTAPPAPPIARGRTLSFLRTAGRRLLRPAPRYALAWIVAFTATGVALNQAWNGYNKPARADGNDAHAQIDFGGQWLMGRMAMSGNAARLYDRTWILRALYQGYPFAAEDPAQTQHDADLLHVWMMNCGDSDAERNSAEAAAGCAAPLAASCPFDSAAFRLAGNSAWSEERLAAVNAPHLGGPLYPPVHAFLYAPFGALPPQPAYRLFIGLNLALTFACGALAARLSSGRVWWPIASTLIYCVPGYAGVIVLSQNSLVSLTLLMAGWLLAVRGRPAAGGVVWGLLAFKPVWAVTFFLATLLSRRWRMALVMGATGVSLVLFTLPWTGVGPWLDWYAIGRAAASKYNECENWIYLSRDAGGLFRRWLLHFDDGWAVNEPDRQALATRLGFALLAAIAAGTLLVAFLRPRPLASADGPGPAFVLLAAWLCCFHFMYYDSVLLALPLFLLFTEPRRFLVPRFLRRRGAPTEAVASYYRPEAGNLLPPPVALVPAEARGRWVVNPVAPTLVVLMIALYGFGAEADPGYRFPPFDTLFALALWAWCGWQCLRERLPAVATPAYGRG